MKHMNMDHWGFILNVHVQRYLFFKQFEQDAEMENSRKILMKKELRKSCGRVGYQNISIFTTRVFNIERYIIFIYIFVIELTTRPQGNLVMGGGYGIFSCSPQDHMIHHKLWRKILFIYNFVIEFTTRPIENLGVGIRIFFIFTTRFGIFLFLLQHHKIHFKKIHHMVM